VCLYEYLNIWEVTQVFILYTMRYDMVQMGNFKCSVLETLNTCIVTGQGMHMVDSYLRL
jgi:hypothetical protein